MKFKFKKPKSKLDEMQEQYLQKTGNIGFHIAYLGLQIIIFIQLIMNLDFKQVAGEYILFSILSVYALLTSSKKGLWSRYFKPGLKYYFLASLGCAAFVALFAFFIFIRYGAIYNLFVDTFIPFAVTFFFSLIIFSILGGICKRRATELEESDVE